MDKKQIVRTVGFLVLAFALCVFLSNLFKYKNGNISKRYYTYKAQEPGAIDAVYLGSSAVDRYWIAAKAYEEYGMTVYPLSTDTQPVCLIINMIKEALRTQTPQLFIIDVRSIAVDADTAYRQGKKGIRYFTDQMDFLSLNRINAVDRSLEFLHGLSPEETPRFDLSYYLPFVQFHGKWNESSFRFSELSKPLSPYLGFHISTNNTMKSVPVNLLSGTEERKELEEFGERYLRELLDYLKDKNLQVLFVASPHAAQEDALKRINTVGDIVEEYGYPYVFYTSEDKMADAAYDADHDFYNDGHVNYYGAEKYTAQFSEYLDEHYDFPDHRTDPRCESWNGVYTRIRNKVESIRKKMEEQG